MWSGPYWRKAPLVLVHRLPLFAAVLAGSLLVALAAASSTLFSTAAGNAALRAKLTQITPFGAGLTVAPPGKLPHGRTVDEYRRAVRASLRGLPQRTARETTALASALRSVPSLGVPVSSLVGPPAIVASAAAPAGVTMQVRPFARPAFEAHVHRLSGGGGDGLWLAASVARYLHVRAGDRLLVQQPSFGGSGEPTAVRVAAVYRPLWAEPQTPYWTGFADIVYPPPAGQDGPTPPTFLLGSPRQLADLALHVGGSLGYQHVVELPVETRGITLRGAERIQARFDALRAELAAGRSPLARSLGCVPAPASGGSCPAHTSLSAAIALARRNIAAVSAPTRLLSDIGVLIALGVFAAAGAYLVARRRAEARLLFSRGVAAPAFAAHAAVESLLPTLLGAAGGFALALALVRVSQPTGALDGVALRSAAARAAAGVAVGLALLAGAAAFSFLRQFEATAWSSRRLGLVPWELPLLGVGAWLLWDVAHGGGVVGRGSSGGAHPTLEVFLLPLLLLAGAAGLAWRLARAALGRAARRDAPLPAYLAVHRLAAGRGALVLLTTLCAVSLGLLFYAETLAGSLAASTREKAYVAVGGDVQATVNAGDRLPRRFPYPLTAVQIAYAGASVGGPAGSQVDVMQVDPRTLGAVIRWDRQWGPGPQRWARELDGSGPLPVVVTSPLRSLRALWISEARVPVRVVAAVRAFPGMAAGPLVVASGQALARAAARAGVSGALAQPSALVWGRGPPAALKAALLASPLRPYYPLTIDDVLRDPDVAVATRTFSFLRALGLAIGMLALVAVLLHLYARQRRQAVASAFARRMGLRPATELLSLWGELAALLAFAAALAAVVALASAGPVVRHTDPIPKYRPGPVVTLPWTWVWATAAGVVVFAAAGAAAAAVLARRADVGEELRLV